MGTRYGIPASNPFVGEPGRDGNVPLATVRVNQELTPSDFFDAGVGWNELGIFEFASSQLVVRLTDDANEYVMADAIRIERVADLAAPPSHMRTDATIGSGTGGEHIFRRAAAWQSARVGRPRAIKRAR